MQNVLTIFEVPTRFFSFVLHVILQEIQLIMGHLTGSNPQLQGKVNVAIYYIIPLNAAS